MRTLTIACFVAVAFAAMVTAAPQETNNDPRCFEVLHQRKAFLDLQTNLRLLTLKSGATPDQVRIFHAVQELAKCITETLANEILKTLCHHGINQDNLDTFCEAFDSVCYALDAIVKHCSSDNWDDLLQLVLLGTKCIECFNCCMKAYNIAKTICEAFGDIAHAVIEKALCHIKSCLNDFICGCGLPEFFDICHETAATSSLTCSAKVLNEGLLRLFAKHPKEWALVAEDLEQATVISKVTSKIALSAATKVATSEEDRVKILAKAFEVTKTRAEKSVQFAAMLGAGVGIDEKVFEGLRNRVRMCVA